MILKVGSKGEGEERKKEPQMKITFDLLTFFKRGSTSTLKELKILDYFISF